jgi:hypothetical protein
VTTAEEMPVTETIDLLGRLTRDTGAHPSAIVANRVLPALFNRREQAIVDRLDEALPVLVDAIGPAAPIVLQASRLTEARRSTGAEHLDRLRTALGELDTRPELPIITVPELFSRAAGPRVVTLVADTLTDDYDVIDFLHVLVARCTELVDVDDAGVMLADPAGQLHAVAASTEQVRLLELFEVQNQDGPCLDAYRTGEPVHASDLAQRQQDWPTFADEALRNGFRAAYSVPMQLRNETIGAINLLSSESRRPMITPVVTGQS